MNGKRLKASIALFFTALATSMMLLGSVVPHHHHGAALCFDLSHCREHGAAVPGADTHSLGHRDCPGASHTDTQAHCTLNLNYYYAGGQEDPKYVFCVAEPAEDEPTGSLFFFFFGAPLPRISVLSPPQAERTLPNADSRECTGLSGLSVGLRAPPVFFFPA